MMNILNSYPRKNIFSMIRAMAKQIKSVSWVMGLQILGGVDTNIFFILFFSGQKYKFLHFDSAYTNA